MRKSPLSAGPRGVPARYSGRPRSEPDNVQEVLSAYLRALEKADSKEAIGAALAALGTHFGMLYLEITTSRIVRNLRRVRTAYRSPDAPRKVLQALHIHPLSAWSLETEVPVSLSELDAKLSVRGLKRATELESVECLMVNVPAAPGRTIHCAFYGKRGTANGLARSLLSTAARLAKEHATKQAWPAADTVALTSPELEVLSFVANGLTDAQVAKAVGLGTRTIRQHLASAKRKAHISSPAELAAMVAQYQGCQPQ